MLGFLPRWLPDELLYSLLSRYRRFAGHPTSKPILETVFGDGAAGISATLPGRLQIVAEQFPDRTTAAQIAANYTILPYFSRIVSPDRYERLRTGLLEGWPTTDHGGLARFLAQVKAHRTLVFCPECVAADVATDGSAGWRRIHQLPGVFVCPDHGTGLRTTGVHVTRLLRLIPCPDDPRAGTAITGLLPADAAQNVARNSAWLLYNPGSPAKPAILRAGIRKMLHNAGWADFPREARSRLQCAISARLGDANLQALQCRINPQFWSKNWLDPLLWGYGDIRAHPLRYLLLLAFLNRDACDLFNCVDQEPPNDAPVSLRRRDHKAKRQSAQRNANLIEAHRTKLLAALRSNSESKRTRGELWRVVKPSMSYLTAHDQEWLNAHLPPKRVRNMYDDWAAVDCGLLPIVRAAIARLEAQPGRPVRISAYRVIRETDHSSILRYNRKRLPLCSAAIEAAAESVVDLGRRRLEWAANELVERGDRFTWINSFVLGQLNKPHSSVLIPYARELYISMQAATPGKPFPGVDNSPKPLNHIKFG
jgi:hypothetical protein